MCDKIQLEKPYFMAQKRYFFAVDLGASSGRTILGTLTEGKLLQEEITRFPNNIIRTENHWYWDIYALYNEIIRGLKTISERQLPIESIGIDTWGVDIVLFGKDGEMLRNPYSYRDPHTVGEMEKYFQDVPRKKVYEIAGTQFMNFNTLFQLSAMKRHGDSALASAENILFIPDALSYLLTGEMVTEHTILSTSGFMDAHTGEISNELLAPTGVTKEQFGRIVQPGQIIGKLTPLVQSLTGLGAIPVVSVAGHDTASAVAAVPATDKDFVYLSSGTWSLMGIESPNAIINEQSFDDNFTNEGGVEGTTRFLKNICGMWLFECSKKEWTNAPSSYDELYAEVDKVTPRRSIINPDAPEFASPISMVKAIQDYCRKTGQPVPETIGEQCRCIYDSLANRYKEVFETLQGFSSHPLKRMHVIGGGSQNYLLNQLIADTLQIPVLAGPAEATAAGNIMLQAQACGCVSNLKEMRKILANSFELKEYLPK